MTATESGPVSRRREKRRRLEHGRQTYRTGPFK